MPNAHVPKYGTGEFPAPRDFDRTRYVRPSGQNMREVRDAPPRRASDPAMAPVKVVVMLCAAVLAVLAVGVVMWASEALPGPIEQADANERHASVPALGSLGSVEGAPTTPQSTPRSEWAAGTAPRLFQTDREWSAAPYADGTVETHGCGPTCLSMAYVALTGQDDLDPRDMAEFSELNGFVDHGVTSWLLMSQGAGLLGLQSEEVPASVASVESRLLAGDVVICSVHKGDFTDEGHFILLAASNGDGTVEIRDPNSEARTDAPWDLGRVIDQCDNIWALSA